jgi:hypothetical protein
MSTPSTHSPPTRTPDEAEIRIISHSNLFYMWPVWAVGFLMGLLSYIDGSRLAPVPNGTKPWMHATVEGFNERGEPSKVDNREVLVLPADKHLLRNEAGKAESPPVEPYLHVATNKNYGVIWTMVLLLVIVITNVPLRGLWSVVVIVAVVLLTIIFALAGWWEHIFNALGRLHIFVNAGGYFFISLALFIAWLVTFVFFDRQIYMVFTPGQLKVCTQIGGGEMAYDTTGMTIQKQRSDLFRHWILGLGSGDLIVNTSGAHAHHFDLPNVLFIGKKVQEIEDMLREKAVVRGR